MNKKIAIVPSVIIVVIIVGVSQVNLEYIPEQTPEVKIVEEIENMIIIAIPGIIAIFLFTLLVYKVSLCFLVIS